MFFSYHKRRADLKTRVHISQLPIGITPLELRKVFAFFGEIVEVNYITKVIQSRRIDTGDRVLIFKQVRHHIPSHVFVRGWRAYVKYAGQPQTCRICGLTGHFAKDCPKSQKEAGAKKAQPESPESKSKRKSPESMDTPMKTQSSTSQVTQVEIMDTPCSKEPVQEHLEELHVTEPNP